MCGIAGIINLVRGDVSPSLKRMGETLIHRGPDDLGYLLWDGKNSLKSYRELPSDEKSILGFVHRRLSIIELSESGWQPMTSADGKYSIVYNGEIYNYLELREELKQLGYQFQTHSDTEVLLAGFQCWGAEVLNKLIGMFAFAILDTAKRKLFFARDFFGIKPLYYVSSKPGFFAFSSEIKSLLTLKEVSRRSAIEPIYHYLRFGILDNTDSTMFADIQQLPPAHWLELSLDDLKVKSPVRYWTLPTIRRESVNCKQATQKLKELFIDSVSLHMRSDVAIGANLSGGIDSSSIVMAMRHITGSHTDINTITYVASDPTINEENFAKIVNNAANAIKHKVVITPNDLMNDLDDLILTQEQPFGSTSIYAQFAVFRAAKNAGIKVMLDGQGADEMLAGYQYYLSARIVSLLHERNFTGAFHLINESQKYISQKLFHHILRIMVGIAPEWLVHKVMGLKAIIQTTPDWLNSKWVKNHKLPNLPFKLQNLHSLTDLLSSTFHTTSLPALLRYADRNSMAHSIESRVPFLTPQLVEYIFSLPESQLIDKTATTKFIFREAMRGLVPDVILNRRDKIGFQTPEYNWLKILQPAIEKILNSDYAKTIPMFNHSAMVLEYQLVMKGIKAFDWRIWRWVNLIRWSEIFNVQYE